MFIADSQVHIWGPNTPERPWRTGREPHRATPLTADELLHMMDEAGVARTILVPPSWDWDRNDLSLEAARRHPDRFAVMGRFDLTALNARSLVGQWRQQPGMLGMRCSLTLPQWAEAFTDGQLDWLWEEAERAGVPIMALVTHQTVHLLDRVAARFPKLKLALCHLGLSTGKRDEEAFRDFDLLLPIAKRPNVMVKVSALPSYTSDIYPYRSLHPYLRKVYDAFGPKRMFWGTDLARLPCDYRQAIAMFTEEIPWLTAEDKGWIMGRALCEWLGWKLPGARR